MFDGVLQVSTGSGSRYVKLRIWERLRLLWTFRNFRILPQQVLTQSQRRLIAAVCCHRKFADPENVDHMAIIGTVELAAVPLKIKPSSQGFGPKRQRAS
jgi:hypothetical protein